MGSRVRNVMSELHGEKIDIVDYSEDPADFVANALSPARVSRVNVIDLAAREAQVIVPDYQLSLAIGKEGQNARLAARLTGWRIDIRSDAAPPSSEPQSSGSASSGSPSPQPQPARTQPAGSRSAAARSAAARPAAARPAAARPAAAQPAATTSAATTSAPTTSAPTTPAATTSAAAQPAASRSSEAPASSLTSANPPNPSVSPETSAS
jgi:septal ring-binding cell division protein DamX